MIKQTALKYGSKVPQNKIKSDVIMLSTWCVVLVLLCCGFDTFNIVAVHMKYPILYIRVRCFKTGAACQKGDADSSGTPGLMSYFPGVIECLMWNAFLLVHHMINPWKFIGYCLLLRTPGPVPFGTCICSNVETILSWTCHIYGPFKIPRYFYFA